MEGRETRYSWYFVPVFFFFFGQEILKQGLDFYFDSSLNETRFVGDSQRQVVVSRFRYQSRSY